MFLHLEETNDHIRDYKKQWSSQHIELQELGLPAPRFLPGQDLVASACHRGLLGGFGGFNCNAVASGRRWAHGAEGKPECLGGGEEKDTRNPGTGNLNRASGMSAQEEGGTRRGRGVTGLPVTTSRFL